jgi:type VI secretion system protein ImpK
MSDDDPFGLMNDAGRTRIRPVGGQGAREPPPTRTFEPRGRSPYDLPRERPPDPAPAWGGGGWGAPPQAAPVRVRHARAHPNPLVASFAPLLELAPELERAAPPQSPGALRMRLLDNLVDARDAAVGRGVPLTRADQAAWFVAALLDDLAMNTPWGGHSDWPRQPLVTQIAGEVDAGTRFFERLTDLQRTPDRDPQLLELAHLCVSLGFRGRHRAEGAQGQAALMQARSASARALRETDRDAGRDSGRAPLSPHWEGVTAPDAPRRFAVPLWTVAVLTVAVAAAIYVGLGMRLAREAERVTIAAAAIPPPERASIFRPVREAVAEAPTIEPEAPEAPPELPLAPVTFDLLPAFEAAAPEALRAALSGREDVSNATLVVRGADPEVFRSARADLNEEYRPLIEAVAATILANADVVGGVTVIGHTDSDPVSASNPFATNQGLSEARAETIARLLVEAGVPEGLVRAEGRADTEPVGDNSTREGRAQNRRVEIRVAKVL